MTFVISLKTVDIIDFLGAETTFVVIITENHEKPNGNADKYTIMLLYV